MKLGTRFAFENDHDQNGEACIDSLESVMFHLLVKFQASDRL